jgi:hypothetical protein
MEPGIVQVTPVHDIKGAYLDGNDIQSVDLVEFSI